MIIPGESMSLIKCKECGQQISRSAKSCPNCGARLKSHPIPWAKLTLIFSLFIFLLILFSINRGSLIAGFNAS